MLGAVVRVGSWISGAAIVVVSIWYARRHWVEAVKDLSASFGTPCTIYIVWFLGLGMAICVLFTLVACCVVLGSYLADKIERKRGCSEESSNS